MAKAWKKLSILALAAALAAMVAMVGCSSEQKSEEATDEKATTETTAEPVELQVFAANSLSKAMEEVQVAYIKDGHSNVTFADTQYKSSGELNEMLGAGSYADLLISASKGSMDTAIKEGYVDEGTRVDMFKNDLVIVSKEGSGLKDVTLQDIADSKYTFCVGDESVPAGNYADQALSTVGVYVPSGDDEGKTGKDISGKNGSFAKGYNPVLDTSVGNVCKHAQSGDVDVAFVYTSDVSLAPFLPTRTRASCTPAPSPLRARTLKQPRNSWIGARTVRRLRRFGRSGASSWLNDRLKAYVPEKHVMRMGTLCAHPLS